MSRPDEAVGESLDVGGSAPAELTASDLFHVLQCERRRLALRYLRNRGRTVNIAALAEQVAAWEHGTRPESLSSSQRQRVYVDLYQSQLAKLDELGLVRYDRSRGEVERTDAVDAVEPYLDATRSTGTEVDSPQVADPERDYLGVYLATAAVGLLLFALAWLGPVGSVGLSFSAVATAVVGLQVALVAGLVATRDR